MDKIITRVRKMIAIRDDRAATQGEIEAATVLISKMLLKYNLTLEQVNKTDDSDYEKQEFMPGQKKMEGKFIQSLYSVIAEHHFCFVVIRPQYNNPRDRNHKSYAINIVGKKHNIEIVEYLCSWLIPRIREMANKSWGLYDGPEKRGKYLRGYLMGCVIGIRDRIREERDREPEQVRAIILKSDVKLKEAVSKIYPNLGTSKAQRSSSYHGRSNGYWDGKSLNLNKGLDNKERGQLNEND